MKRHLLILLICLMFGIGCDSDSTLHPYTYPVSPMAPTKTLRVPGTYNSIQAAINAAGTGDFIRVDAGTFSEKLQISRKHVSLRGAGKGQTILQGSVTVSDNANVSFEGFTVTGGGIFARDSVIRIAGNEISHNSGPGIQVERCTGVGITFNDIHDNEEDGIVFTDSIGNIGSTFVTQNSMDGIVINNSSPGLTGNRVTKNGRDGISIRGLTSDASPHLLENIAQGNGGASNSDVICIGGRGNPTGNGNTIDRCLNCYECRSFTDPVTYKD